jgi:phosphatidylglycerophosphate synthase
MQRAARWLSRQNITPNQISLASIVFAALAALCLVRLSTAEAVAVWPLSLMAVFFILCRALCNMFDGMVAVEGGKKTASGELFNDIPDRIADPLIIVSAGYAADRRELGAGTRMVRRPLGGDDCLCSYAGKKHRRAPRFPRSHVQGPPHGADCDCGPPGTA